MNRRMTDKDLKIILEAIDYLEDATWSELLSTLSKRGINFSRQSLSAKKEIKTALKLRKEAIRSALESLGVPSITKSQSISQIAKMAKEIEVLRKQNSQLYELMLIWQHNAELHGLTDEQLNKPLPRINRA